LLDNNAYNLLMQLTQEHKTLWRIKNKYKKDAKACSECKEFWLNSKRKGKNVSLALKNF
jgi:hypothetical protein